MQAWYEQKTLGALLDEAAARWGAREALTYEGQRWSFAELQTEVDRLTAAIAQICDRPAENVHIIYLPEGAGRIAFGGKVIGP